MQLHDINEVIEKLSTDKIEGFLEVLADQLKAITKRGYTETCETTIHELDTQLESKQDLYDTLFERLRALKKASGDRPPKYMGIYTIEQMEQEFKRPIADVDEFKRLNKII